MMKVCQVYFAAAMSVALIGLLSLSIWAPWQQVSDADAHRVVSLPRAPIWAHSDVPGATVNVQLYLIDAIIILAIAGVIVKVGMATRTRVRLPKS